MYIVLSVHSVATLILLNKDIMMMALLFSYTLDRTLSRWFKSVERQQLGQVVVSHVVVGVGPLDNEFRFFP